VFERVGHRDVRPTKVKRLHWVDQPLLGTSACTSRHQSCPLGPILQEGSFVQYHPYIRMLIQTLPLVSVATGSMATNDQSDRALIHRPTLLCNGRDSLTDSSWIVDAHFGQRPGRGFHVSKVIKETVIELPTSSIIDSQNQQPGMVLFLLTEPAVGIAGLWFQDVLPQQTGTGGKGQGFGGYDACP